MNIRHVKWEEIVALTTDTLTEPMETGKYTSVYPLMRGGLPIAAVVSNYFKIPIRYDIQGGCLIVDDVCDTGATLKKYERCDCDSFTLFARRRSFETPSLLGCLVSDDIFLVFPWENPAEAEEEAKRYKDKGQQKWVASMFN